MEKESFQTILEELESEYVKYWERKRWIEKDYYQTMFRRIDDSAIHRNTKDVRGMPSLAELVFLINTQ